MMTCAVGSVLNGMEIRPIDRECPPHPSSFPPARECRQKSALIFGYTKTSPRFPFCLMPMPQIYIIAGPNGVGKTTYVKRFLPEQVHCLEFLNADMIALGLAPFAPEKASMRAGR
jgi:hypothetical protein